MSTQIAEVKNQSSRASTYWALLSNEIRSNFKFIFYWILGINAYFLLAVTIYPGEEAVNSFLNLVESEEAFQAFLGSIGGENAGYRTWLALMLPFIVVAVFIYGLMLGVRLSVGAISDDTGELIHPQPVTRVELLGIRYLVGIFGSIDMILVSSLLLMIPVHGESVPFDNILTYAGPGILFTMAAVAAGMVFGILAADTGRGYMFSLFFAIYLYVMQTTSNFIDELQDVSEYIPLNWFSPSDAILSNEIPDNTIIYILVFLFLSLSISFLMFTKRDLIKEAAIPIPIISTLTRKFSRSGGTSDRDKLMLMWARPLEKKLPFTADFVYSERKALLITFWAIILFYPAQILIFRPNDAQFLANLQTTVDSFGNSGIMKIFTYGHDISGDLYLWFIITNAIGNHYFIFLPLAAHWIKKILQSDSDNMTGEIYGALSLKSRNVMLQRIFAVLLELIFIVSQMVFWLIVSERIIGYTTNQTWRVIAILAIIPLYIFLISAGIVVGLLIKSGVRIARLTLIGLILLFIAGTLLDGPTGIFGLYDPVLIITEKSLAVANYGVFLLSGMALISSILVFTIAKRYQWLDIPTADPNIASKS